MRSSSTAWHRRQRFDPKRTHVTVDEVYRKLRQIEMCRAEAEQAWLVFCDWLDNAPALADKWNAFIASGGLTAAEFVNFLDGKPVRRAVHQRGHLRLIDNQQLGKTRRR